MTSENEMVPAVDEILVAMKAQQFATAERLCQDILVRHPEAANVCNILGVAVASLGRSGEAVEHFRRAFWLRPGHYPYARNLLTLLCGSQAFDEARTVQERFAAEQPGTTDAADLLRFFEQASGRTAADHRQTFEEIYRRNVWGGGSGLGSSVPATQDYRTFLQAFLAMNRITEVVDLGCGDWSFSKLIDWSGIGYLGIDVAETALNSARQYQSDTISFRNIDVLKEEMPGSQLLIVKDVLQHWPNADVSMFLSRLGRFDMALITNRFAEFDDHPDIFLGNTRAINLHAAPFRLPGQHVFQFKADDLKATFLWQRPRP